MVEKKLSLVMTLQQIKVLLIYLRTFLTVVAIPDTGNDDHQMSVLQFRKCLLSYFFIIEFKILFDLLVIKFVRVVLFIPHLW